MPSLTQFIQKNFLLIVLLTLNNIPLNIAHSQNATQINIAIDWASDGIKLAIGYQGSGIEVIDTTTGEQLWTSQFTGVVRSLKWNPINAHQLAIGGINSSHSEGIVQIWDVTTNQLIHTLEGGALINEISWSPDGTRLATTNTPMTPSLTIPTEIRIWDTITGELLNRIPATAGIVNTIAWSPDGTNLAGGTVEYLVAIWDVNTGALLHTVEGHAAVITSVAWNFDGTLLASTSFGLDDNLSIWDASSWQRLTTFPIRTMRVIWHPQRNEVALTNIDAVMILEATTGDILELFPTTTFQSAIAYSPYGARIAFSNSATEVTNNQSARTLAFGTVQIIVPAPSLERLHAIAQLCGAPADLQPDPLEDFTAHFDTLDIPPACRADLLAIAAALQAPSGENTHDTP